MYLSNNYYKIIDDDIIKFCEEARKIYYHITSLNLSDYSLDDIIERPFAIQMSRNFLLKQGFSSFNIIFNKTEFFLPKFRFIITGRKGGSEIFPPHMDTCENSIMPAVINLPLINCNEQTITNWYRVIKGQPYWNLNSGGEIKSVLVSNRTPWCNNCELEVVEEGIFYDNEPILFRTSRWHSVVNKSSKPRVVASLMINPLMLWEDLVLHFKENGVIGE